MIVIWQCFINTNQPANHIINSSVRYKSFNNNPDTFCLFLWNLRCLLKKLLIC